MEALEIWELREMANQTIMTEGADREEVRVQIYPKKHWLHKELDALAVDIVRSSPECRATKAEIIEGFRKAGAPDGPDLAVKAALQRCLKAGTLSRPQQGIYEWSRK